MKKPVLILTIVLVLTFMTALTASATKPVHVQGFVPLGSYNPGPEYEEYDVCDPYLTGHVVQPAASPGFAIHGTFTSGSVSDCPYATELSGTCKITLIPVEEFGNPDSKRGRGILGRCTGDLKGFHARYLINEWFEYDAWYHIDP
jgi:hypothetical protein